MEPRDLLRLIVRRLWVVVAVGLVGLALALTNVLMTPSVYEATSRVFVSTRTATNLSDVNQGANFTQSIVKSYAEVATSPLVLQPVIDELHLGDTMDEFSKRVQATASLDTVIIDISVQDRDAARAQRIANAVSGQLAKVVDRLTFQKPDDAVVSITRIQAATLASGRVSPKPSVLLPIGLLVGLLVGLVLVLVVEALTRRLHSVRDTARVSGLPVLAGLPSRARKVSRRPLIAGAPGADGYRALRAALAARTDPDSPRSVVVTGAQRSVGATTVAANLAIALAEGGLSVVLVEANLRTPSLSTFLDLPTRAGLDEVLTGEAELDAALTPWGDHGLTVLITGAVADGGSDLLEGRSMRDLMSNLATRFDVVLYDAPDLLGSSDGAVLAARLDGAVVVVEAGRTGAGSLRDGLDAVSALGGTTLGLVVTGLPRRGADAPRIRT